MTRPRGTGERQKRFLGRRRWTPGEEGLLEQLAGTTGLTRIAEQLGRSISSVSAHAAARGISLALDGYSMNELSQVLGVTHYRFIREWIQTGLLRGEKNPGRGRYGQFQVGEEALVAFLEAHPHLVDRQRVDPAFQQYVDERWITLGEAFRRGAAHVVSLEHAYRCGLLPQARRRGLWIVVPERVLPVLVAGRRKVTNDVEHRRQWMKYNATQRRRRPIRREAYQAKQQFDADPIVARILEVGRRDRRNRRKGVAA